jgi:hypothetical protein
VDIEYEWRQLSKLQFAVYVRDVRITPLSLEFLTEEPVPVVGVDIEPQPNYAG